MHGFRPPAAGRTALMFCALCAALAQGKAVHIAPPGQQVERAPGEDVLRGLGELRNALRDDAEITEVIVHDGEYVGGCSVDTPVGVTPEKRRLLIRAADGARPVCRVSVPIENAAQLEGTAEVGSIPHKQAGGETPKLWDAAMRER